ncbi:cytochrome c oxidase subunit II [Arcobacter sp. 31_11_sub10_T18]|nr:cytochrome c oxidase subunit II [Arcobacter sp. 31_11_sub10_T18]
MLEGIEGVSSFAAETDYVFWVVNLICLFLFVVTIGAMFVFLYKYNEKKSKPEDTENIKHHTPMEIAWTVIPTILMMVIFYLGLDVLKVQRTMPKDKDAIVVEVVGKKWSWSYTYANGKKSSNLVVPVNKDVKLNMTAPLDDVLHAYYVAAFRIKEDVVPGQVTKLWFNANRIGEYDVQCAEYCGTRHAYMRSVIKVVSQEDYEEYLNPTVVAAKTAMDVFNENGCIGCHTTDGTVSAGPSFKDIYNTEIKVLANGVTKTVTRDEAYLIRAIEDPDAEIVEGYTAGMMPSFKGAINAEDMKIVMNYFKGIKPEPVMPKIDGKEVVDINGCIGCHTTDGNPSAGPTFKDIYNRKTTIIKDGKTIEVAADAAYLREAILNPATEIVDGYMNIMPPFKDVLKDEEVDAIIEYLKN